MGRRRRWRRRSQGSVRLLSNEPLSDELWSNERSATARERARALVVVAVIFGSAALVAGLALRTTEGAALGVVLLALTAFGGAVAWKFDRIWPAPRALCARSRGLTNATTHVPWTASSRQGAAACHNGVRPSSAAVLWNESLDFQLRLDDEACRVGVRRPRSTWRPWIQGIGSLGWFPSPSDQISMGNGGVACARCGMDRW